MSNLRQFPSHTSAISNSPRIPDAAQREQALDIRASWIVEAPAGSGKTGLIIQRFLHLLADDSVTQPEQVLAITFTVKATTEMRDRVLHHLEAAQKPAPADESDFDRATRALATAALTRSQTLAWDILAQPQRLNIRTIDSISSEIVRALPILSGGGGPRHITRLADSLHREAARRTLMLLGGDDPALDTALRTLLRHRDGSLAGCQRLIAEMLASREQWGALVPLDRYQLDDDLLDNTLLPRLQRTLEEIICAGLTRLARIMPAPILAELTSLAAEFAHNDGYKGETSPLTFCAQLHTPPGEAAEHLAHWRALIHLLIAPSSADWRSSNGLKINTLKFAIDKSQRARLARILDELRGHDELRDALCEADALPPTQYPPEQWLIAKALFRILRQAMIELQLLFAERGECDYTEITLGARAALAHDAAASDYAVATGLRLQHLLVDEMQDTSLSQYDLIEQLTRGWDGRSQTVFLVGDPKQSIYLFRQARVERFLRIMNDANSSIDTDSQHGRLGDIPLGRLRLTANFRSQPRLVGQFNDTFAEIFPTLASRTSTADVPFVEATAVRQPNGEDGLIWHTTLIDSDQTAEQELSDSSAICNLIQQWRTSPCKIAILVRARAHLAPMVRALRSASIPFRAVDVEALDQRQEVLDLLALTRALLHPADHVAWLAILRAPWCGLSLADLHLLTGADNPTFAKRSMESVIQDRASLLPPESQQRLARTIAVLSEALAQHGRLTLAQWVERTWRTLGGDAPLTPAELANARYFLRLLDQVEREDAFFNLTLLQQTMSRLFAQAEAVPGAVDLMTIHGAKGLEWDYVIVPSLERQTQSNRSRLLSWVELDLSTADAAHILLAPIHGAGEDSGRLNRWIASVHKTRDAAERKRLFYVACTRARQQLHLFAAPARRTDDAPSVPSTSLLSAAWPAARHHFGNDIISFPQPKQDTAEEPTTFDLAATGEPGATPGTAYRLPLDFDPQARFQQSSAQRLFTPSESTYASDPIFHRPQGSFAARALGNTIHACIEQLAHSIAQNQSPETLLQQLDAWEPRILALLRNSSLPPADLKSSAARVLTALRNTLTDPTGQWLLAPHLQAASEQAFDLDTGATIRLDRIFLAGPEPGAAGNGTQWIVDFKTTQPAGQPPDEFLAQQQTTYREQMTTYARALHNTNSKSPIHLGLYYPLARLFTWWSYQSD